MFMISDRTLNLALSLITFLGFVRFVFFRNLRRHAGKAYLPGY